MRSEESTEPRNALRMAEVVGRLKRLVGQDLRTLADRHGVTVFRQGKLNKGWVGHVTERCLGLSLSSAQAPDGVTWELKVVSLSETAKGWKPKETMQITMINPVQVERTPFEESHLYTKLRRVVICGREFVDRRESRARLIAVGAFNLDDPGNEHVREQIKHDYEAVRAAIRTQGFSALTGHMGVLVQPRTKGPGHGSTSRAFYGRKALVALMLGLPPP
jgi:DNA mismatch repair protein MutH